MKKGYQICTRCIMDTTDPNITFDEKGECSHCKKFDAISERLILSTEEKKKQLAQIVEKIKRDGEGKPYDCVIGVSGGVDSTYTALSASSTYGGSSRSTVTV